MRVDKRFSNSVSVFALGVANAKHWRLCVLHAGVSIHVTVHVYQPHHRIQIENYVRYSLSILRKSILYLAKLKPNSWREDRLKLSSMTFWVYPQFFNVCILLNLWKRCFYSIIGKGQVCLSVNALQQLFHTSVDNILKFISSHRFHIV